MKVMTRQHDDRTYPHSGCQMTWRKTTTALGVALALSVLASPSASAAAGDLDTTFSRDGKETTDIYFNQERANDVAVQRDDKIVAVGTYGGGTVRQNFALVRYLATGGLDKSFGANGRRLTDFDGDDDVAHAVAIQSDGKIVVAGSTRVGGAPSDFAVARYLPSGALDTTFGGDGRVSTAVGTRRDVGRDVVIQPDGKIVVVGYWESRSGEFDFAVVRYTTSGALDKTFGGRGAVGAGLGANDYAVAAALQPDGKIIAAGSRSEKDDDCFGCLDLDLAMARYNSDGTLDASFDGDGKMTRGIGGDEEINAVALGSDGKITVAGRNNDGGLVARFYSNGGFDKNFRQVGHGGYRFDGKTTLAGVGLRSDGKMIVAGTSVTSGGDFAVARLLEDGRMDTTFSGNGFTKTGFGSSDFATAMTLLPSGKIVVGGWRQARDGGTDDFAVARYLQ